MSPKDKNKEDKNQGRGGKGTKQQTFAPSQAEKKPTVSAVDFPKLAFPEKVQQPTQKTTVIIKKWVLENNIPVGVSNNTVPVFILHRGNVVNIKRQDINVPGSDILWSEIDYKHSEYSQVEKKYIESTVTGWVDGFFLDDYNEIFPNYEVTILHPTEDPHDAQQYMYFDADSDGRLDADVKVNMCGEFCVTYIVNREIEAGASIESVLEKWRDTRRGTKRTLYNKDVVKGGLNHIYIKDMIRLYPPYNNDQDPDQVLDFKEGLKNGSLDWDGMKDRIKTHYLIANVKINGSGSLIKNSKEGSPHWVVIERITPTHDGKQVVGRRVLLYNPFLNKLQEYSFNEFVSSCSTGRTGLWIKRKKEIKLEDDPSAPLYGVQLDEPKPQGYTGEQYIDRVGEAVKKKTQLCGEFCVAYIVGKSIDTTLKYWMDNPPSSLQELVAIVNAYGQFQQKNKEGLADRHFTIGTVLDAWKKTQPKLYGYYVGENKPTGFRELITILKAYGYTTSPGDFTGFRPGLMDGTRYLPSPGKLAEKLRKNFLIAGVGIDTYGRLITGPAVRHWVVVEKITPVGKDYLKEVNQKFEHVGDGNGGWVELYNPFTNILEEYSYWEFRDSMSETGLWDGLWVTREVRPVLTPQEILEPVIDEPKKGKEVPNKKPITEIWPKNKLLEEIEKKIKKGKPAKDIPALLFRESGWSKERIASFLPASNKNDNKPVDTPVSLVCKHLGVDSLPAEIEKWLSEKTRGNLSYAVDLANALRGSGILVIEDKKARVIDAAVPSLQIPSPIVSLIGAIFASKTMEELKKFNDR